jgi:hypothetical protein
MSSTHGVVFQTIARCQPPVGWFFNRWHVEPMSWHACLVKPMPFAHNVACLAISWHAFSSPCRGMPCQADVEACRALVEACRVGCLVKPMSRHVEPMSWQGMASPASSIFFYASFKKHLSWPLHFMFVHALAFFMPCAWHRARQDMPCRANVEPMSWHALCQCLGM